jgi:hypothetical protein
MIGVKDQHEQMGSAGSVFRFGRPTFAIGVCKPRFLRALSLGATRRLAQAYDLGEDFVPLKYPRTAFPPCHFRLMTESFPHLTQFILKLRNACFQSPNYLVSFHGSFPTHIMIIRPKANRSQIIIADTGDVATVLQSPLDARGLGRVLDVQHD